MTKTDPRTELALSLVPFISGDDGQLDRATFLQYVADRISDDKRERELIAFVSIKGAHEVADYLNRTIPTQCPQGSLKRWEEVRDALYAITNDTDQIRSRDDDGPIAKRKARLGDESVFRNIRQADDGAAS